MKTLGIETSCDETAIAVFDSEQGIIGESVYSQIKMHAEYGGVVPELASRDHCVKIITVLEEALGDIDLHSIDQVAYTSGPGLLGALLIGESFAQGLSTALNVPLIPINHLEGHLMSPIMEFPEIIVPLAWKGCTRLYTGVPRLGVRTHMYPSVPIGLLWEFPCRGLLVHLLL